MILYILFLIMLFYVIFYSNRDVKKLIRMYVRSEKSVRVLIKGGLGNRLMSFAVTNWKEFDLLYYVPNYNITTANDRIEILNSICPLNLDKFYRIKQKNNTYFDYLWCDLIVKLMKNKRFILNKEEYIKNYKYVDDEYIYHTYYFIFNKLLLVKKQIIDRVKYFFNSMQYNKYIGIQIRTGNDDLKEKKVSDENDVNIMLNIAQKFKKYKKWYLTGDSVKYKKILTKKYNKINVYSLNKTKHYAKCPKEYSIIIEHEILSKSSLLIVSKSSYGFTASLKSGLLLNRKYINYYVYNGSIYDIRFHYTKPGFL